MAGHDFREDIPPSFEWWRKFVYEPAHKEIFLQMDRNRKEMVAEVTIAKQKVDATMKLLWGLLIVNLTGMIGIVSLLLTRQHLPN